MKIKTIEKLQEKLEEDLSWRKKELINIKTLIEDETNNIDKNILIRSGIALLCAHWEGYIRYVANMYIVYICNINIKTKELKENFLALLLRKDIVSSGMTEKTSVHIRLIDKIKDIRENKFYIRYSEDNRIIKTNSNLSYELFNEILKSINIENKYELKKNYIDYNLLKRRHEIVHGEKTEFEIEDFISTFNIITNILEEFKDQVISAAENKVYLKENLG
ncbi:MAE_28990/MAE_18760 family HEPN-like nuclease [Clostridium perfringens]|uniref:MAE_28990/MAE_18760 family HEPN-like nuclease n=2 Tax=Clostridium perfringens TaxID=1502 RepID=UPI000DBE66A1|nr:MAE_28990/MAE_18760 family HEPN-like nuclease [Clostridium perfringens]EGT0692021.1 hypothetical protein [Clostridium perfringens]EIF6155156.1 hypothetical protein [Clostridium perfringens]EIF6174745.1 hypothetical protein [Clostridium perfringens]ELC8464163.1 hypothetical protein [Clostridium perfringens]MDU4419689.1 MAE_28990/MAE_18760 family HEPN-like nuclease [Clostridium perfringens]